MIDPQRQEAVQSTQLVVVKIGSRVLTTEDWSPRYRGSAVPRDWIFVGCIMDGVWGNKDEITRAMELVQKSREDTQPIRTRTGGSTFAQCRKQR